MEGAWKKELSAVLFVQACADGHCIFRIDGCRIEIDVFDHAVLVDHKCCAPGEFHLFATHGKILHDAILLQHLAIHVAQQRESNANLLGKRSVGGRTVYADSENH